MPEKRCRLKIFWAALNETQSGRVIFESTPASGFGLLSSAKMDFDLVLHRPIETAALIRHVPEVRTA
jgi:hypothetical protein